MTLTQAIMQITTESFIAAAIVSALIFLCRNLILTRLKNAVKFEYDIQLASHIDSLRKATESRLKELESVLRKDVETDLAKLNLRLKVDYDHLQYSFKKETTNLENLWSKVMAVVDGCAKFTGEKDMDQLGVQVTDLEAFIVHQEPFIDSTIVGLTRDLIDIADPGGFVAQNYKEIRKVRNRLVTEVRNRLRLKGSVT